MRLLEEGSCSLFMNRESFLPPDPPFSLAETEVKQPVMQKYLNRRSATPSHMHGPPFPAYSFSPISPTKSGSSPDAIMINVSSRIPSVAKPFSYPPPFTLTCNAAMRISCWPPANGYFTASRPWRQYFTRTCMGQSKHAYFLESEYPTKFQKTVVYG